MDWQRALFDGWAPVGRTVFVGVLAYVALVALLRNSGKRTLSKFNAFDFVVTVALGSTLATILLSRDVSLAQGVAGFLTLVVLQFAITWLSVRSARVRAVVKGEPTLLVHRGRFLDGALRRTRVTRDEVLAAARSQGIASLDEVAGAVLETDGTVTLVRGEGAGGAGTLAAVDGPPHERGGAGEPGAGAPTRGASSPPAGPPSSG